MTALAWLHDGNYFVSASLDKSLVLWHKNGASTPLAEQIRVYDLCVSLDEKFIIAACPENRIRFFDLESVVGLLASLADAEEEEAQDRFDAMADEDLLPLHELAEMEITEIAPVVTLTLSPDGIFIVACLNGAGIHAWNMRTGTLAHSFDNDAHGRYIIKSSFGGGGRSDEVGTFVSGGEDGSVSIWSSSGGVCCSGLGATLRQ